MCWLKCRVDRRLDSSEKNQISLPENETERLEKQENNGREAKRVKKKEPRGLL